MLECPAYRHISGHGYGTLYPGPLGLALVPVLAGYEEYKDITKICSLCSACNDVCPVKIPLYQSILEHRRVIAEEKQLLAKTESSIMSLYGQIIGSSSFYDLGTRLTRFTDLLPKIGPLKEWHKERELPKAPKLRFRDWYRKHEKKEASND